MKLILLFVCIVPLYPYVESFIDNNETAHSKDFFRTQKACKLGNMKECVSLGLMYSSGIGMPQNYQKARVLFEQACNGYQNRGCTYLADFYLRGIGGVKKDYERAAQLYKKACDNDYFPACNAIGKLSLLGKGVKKDNVATVKYFSLACSGGYMEACNNIATLYANGLAGLERNYKKAKKIYEKTCFMGLASGCTSIGDIYYKGYGTHRDFDKAINFYEKGCLHSNEISYPACTNAALLHLEEKHYTKAKTLLEKACQGEYGGGCVQLGQLYIKGEGVPKDSDKALKLFLHGCDLNVSTGCYNAAGVYIKYKKKTQPAMPLLKKACSLKDKDACQLFETISKHTKTKSQSQIPLK